MKVTVTTFLRTCFYLGWDWGDLKDGKNRKKQTFCSVAWLNEVFLIGKGEKYTKIKPYSDSENTAWRV